MPNAAAASFDDDFGYAEPRRAQAPRKARTTGGKARTTGDKKKKGGRFSLHMPSIARYTAIGMSATIALGIMANALIFQKGHHPAPLFAKVAPPAQTASRQVVPPIAKPVADRGSDIGGSDIGGSDIRGSDNRGAGNDANPTAPAPQPVAKPRRVATMVEKSVDDDPIAKLLQHGATTSAGGGGDHADKKTILAAQRALSKLGFDVKANGAIGPATKKAIERFEKEHHLPIKGELSRRVVKALSAESGMRID